MAGAYDLDGRPVRVTVTVHQNPYRAPGDDEMTAVLVVRAPRLAAATDLRLRITTRPPARVRYLKQFVPDLVDLTGHAERVDDRTVEFGTGSRTGGTREFLVSFAIDGADAPTGEPVPVARVDVLAGGEVVAVPGTVTVRWTRDGVAPSRIEAPSRCSVAVSGTTSTSAPFPDASTPAPAGPDRVCRCGRISPGDAAVCTACGRRLDERSPAGGPGW